MRVTNDISAGRLIVTLACVHAFVRQRGFVQTRTSIFMDKFQNNLVELMPIMSIDIHAIRPGLSGTVPDFDTLSRRHGNYEIVPEI